jgi:hypothetical protein
MKKIKQI